MHWRRETQLANTEYALLKRSRYVEPSCRSYRTHLKTCAYHHPVWPFFSNRTQFEHCIVVLNLYQRTVSSLTGTASVKSATEVIPEPKTESVIVPLVDWNMTMDSPETSSVAVWDLLWGMVWTEDDAWVKYIFGVMLGVLSYGIVYLMCLFMRFLLSKGCLNSLGGTQEIRSLFQTRLDYIHSIMMSGGWSRLGSRPKAIM